MIKIVKPGRVVGFVLDVWFTATVLAVAAGLLLLRFRRHSWRLCSQQSRSLW
jgi:hypothetical protein